MTCVEAGGGTTGRAEQACMQGTFGTLSAGAHMLHMPATLLPGVLAQLLTAPLKLLTEKVDTCKQAQWQS